MTFKKAVGISIGMGFGILLLSGGDYQKATFALVLAILANSFKVD